jgi:hypothetical protein
MKRRDERGKGKLRLDWTPGVRQPFYMLWLLVSLPPCSKFPATDTLTAGLLPPDALTAVWVISC